MMMNPESAPAVAGGITADDRTWGMAAHLSALSGLVVPMGNILGPLIIWLVKKETSEFVADQAKEALNFQIAVLIVLLVSIPLCFVLIGFLTFGAAAIYGLVMEIIAGLKANEGIRYRYPITLRLIK